MPKTLPKKPTASVQPKVVTDLAELEALCAAPVTVTVLMKGTPFTFTGRRLIPAETKHVKLLLEAALPPIVAAEGGEAKYDASDPKYLERLEDNRRAARALAIWLAFPVFRAEAAKETRNAERGTRNEPSDRIEDVVKFIESRKLEDDILEQLFNAVKHRTVDAQAYMGFTFGGTSPTS